MSFGPLVIALVVVGGILYLLFIRTVLTAASASHPFALRAELAPEAGQLRLVIRHLRKTSRTSVTGVGVDRELVDKLALEPPSGFAAEPYTSPDAAEFEADLEELADAGVELTDQAIDLETSRQFQAYEEMTRTLNRTTVRYAGRLKVAPGQTSILPFHLSRIVPATGTILVTYSYRAGLGAIDSGQSIKVVLTADPTADENEPNERHSLPTATFRVAPLASKAQRSTVMTLRSLGRNTPAGLPPYAA